MSKGYLTTHVLDTYNGKPGSNIKGQIFKIKNDKKIKIKDFILNLDGRCENPVLENDEFTIGKFEIIFFCGEYFKGIKNLTKPFFIDDVIIRFGINDENQHYHVPLLVSPWSYSTYKGS
jgi:5-hydroxyisourate hydrolase